MVFGNRINFENLPFNFNSSNDIKNLIIEIENIVGYTIPFYIDNSTNNFGYVRMPISAGNDISNRLSIFCRNFDEISEGYLLHELLHLYRHAIQIPTWNPLGINLGAQDYIILDDLIEHNWIYKKYDDFSINFDPYKDLIDRSKEDIKFKEVKEFISDLNSLNRNDVDFKYKALKLSLIALELSYNCPNNTFTRKLKKKIMKLDDSSIISQTTDLLENYLISNGIENKETKLEFIKLMGDTLNFPDKWKKYMSYQKKWIFYDWN